MAKINQIVDANPDPLGGNYNIDDQLSPQGGIAQESVNVTKPDQHGQQSKPDMPVNVGAGKPDKPDKPVGAVANRGGGFGAALANIGVGLNSMEDDIINDMKNENITPGGFDENEYENPKQNKHVEKDNLIDANDSDYINRQRVVTVDSLDSNMSHISTLR